MNRWALRTFTSFAFFVIASSMFGACIWALLPHAVRWVLQCSMERGGQLCRLAAFLANYWWILLFPVLLLLAITSAWMSRRVVQGR
jgi:H+/Cl- antiporter ClcA